MIYNRGWPSLDRCCIGTGDKPLYPECDDKKGSTWEDGHGKVSTREAEEKLAILFKCP